MAYTEFYCQNGGSNVNAGSTTNNTAAYTSTNGNWNGSTIFTPTDGSTPASSIVVGDWVSIYLDGAAVTVSVSRVTAVAAGVNGAITVSSTARAGTVPTSGATGRTLKAGGAWQGPNGTSGFPFTVNNLGSMQDATPHRVRINLKNDQTYTMTAAVTTSASIGQPFTIQGYTSSPGDLGKATVDGGTSGAAYTLWNNQYSSGLLYADIIWKNNGATSSASLFSHGSSTNVTMLRCVITGSRGNGLILGGTQCYYIECEFYNNNLSNTSGQGGVVGGNGIFINCISHDNTGSNSAGWACNVSTPALMFINCISESNGGKGWDASFSTGIVMWLNCDAYNNTSDGIAIPSTSQDLIWIINSNFVKNGGWGINITGATHTMSGLIANCGFGSGTQANSSGKINNLVNVIETGTVDYASGVTPWTDPANGDFRINLAAAKGAGRGAFTQTAASYAGAVGYPDIGAVQALITGGGASEASYSFG